MGDRMRARILAVDDEPRGVELVKRILRRKAVVETATSGEEAWELFEKSAFDLVISDQRMPGMSGVELLARVANRSLCTGRILLTGYADTVDTVDAINVGRVHAYLSKPCPPDQLCLAVDAVLERVETLRENARLADLLRSREQGAAGAWGLERAALEAIARDLVGCVEALRAEAGELAAELRGGAERRIERIVGEGERIGELTDALLKAATRENGS